MPRYRDITGQKFGRLTVLHPIGTNKSGQMQWSCRCDCGVEKAIVGAYAIAGTVKSCGCLQREATRNRQSTLSKAAVQAAAKRPNKCIGFAKDLREARIAQGLTQEALADKAGYNVSAIHKMEVGASRPTLDLVADCAQALGFRLVLEKTEFH